MDVAVAEMAEGEDARARLERFDRARRRSRKAGTAPTATDTSCLIDPPSWTCASGIDSRSVQKAWR